MPRKARSLRELLALTPPDIQYIVEPQLLPVGGSMFIYGESETLKSWIAMELLFAVTQGTPWLGTYATTKGSGLMLQTEQTEMMYRARALKFTENMNGTAPLDNLYIYSEVAMPLDNAVGLGMLSNDLKEIKPSLLILDNLFESVSSVSDEVGIKKFLRGMNSAQHNKPPSAVVIVHHTRKQGNEEAHGMEDLAGMQDLNKWADTVIKVTVTEYSPGGRPQVVRLDMKKVKNAEEDVQGVTIRFNRSTVRFKIEI
jgi:RecA-family ATPase